jgi:hypothetical protein
VTAGVTAAVGAAVGAAVPAPAMAQPDGPVGPCTGPRHVSILDADAVLEGNPTSLTGRAPQLLFLLRSSVCGLAGTLSFEIHEPPGSTPGDVRARAGVVHFKAGDLSDGWIAVPVASDLTPEQDETVAVTVAAVGNSVVVNRCLAEGKIINDDIGPPADPPMFSRLHCSE